MKINMKIENKDIKRVVPSLRFPEFRDAEGWRITALSEVLSYERPDNYIVSNTNYCQQGIPVLTANKSFILGYTKDDHGIYNSYPVIIFDDFTTDKKYVDFPFKVKSSAIKILKSKNGYNLRFVFEMMSLIQFEAKEHKRYYISSYQTLNICIPKQCEQTKIADCLSSLDDLISAVTDKIETLKEYKKGLMQQLFPAEGKTTPALRFPEFQNAGEWENTVLGEEVHYENGKAHENDIDEAGHYIVVNSKFISTDGEVVKYTNHPSCLADKGDILMVLSDVPNGRAIAKCFIVDCNTKYTVNQRICKLKSKQAVSLLLYYIINRNPFLLSFDDGIKQTNLKKDEVLNLQFRLPEDTKEQQTIADFLSSVDELISVETDKLDQLKAHKKGLMQQLFPTLNE